ncbi:MAG: hypothetical protein UV51_C0007G0003 [Candidatus Woesebacteria bacterium GW2011_GWC1_42_9]|nr:MAG: hypothetical protein UV51_C0007G0003 [Candidatus Woesebacteria bacterium GW2011_GWC1_42_9]
MRNTIKEFNFSIINEQDYMVVARKTKRKDVAFRIPPIPQQVVPRVVIHKEISQSIPTPTLVLRKKPNLPYSQLPSGSRKIYNDLFSFIKANTKDLSVEFIHRKLRAYNLAYEIFAVDNKIYIELENFRIPEIGCFEIQNLLT